MPEPRTYALAPALLGLLLAGPLSGQEPDWTEMTIRRQADGVGSLQVEVRYALGELRIHGAREGLLYDAHLRYDAARFDPSRRWTVEDGVGHLRLGFESRAEVDWDDLEDLEVEDLGFLDLGLSRQVPTDLKVEVGAAVGRLDLGGIALSRLDYRTGASETDLTFSAPNSVRMESLRLAVGAADFDATRLGDARFDRLTFEGAVGDVRLDFTGTWDGNAVAEISMGLGSLTLVLPRSLGVRVKKSGFLAAFDADGFERVEGDYRTPNWASARHRLEIEVKAALGAISVDFVR